MISLSTLGFALPVFNLGILSFPGVKSKEEEEAEEAILANDFVESLIIPFDHKKYNQPSLYKRVKIQRNKLTLTRNYFWKLVDYIKMV